MADEAVARLTQADRGYMAALVDVAGSVCIERREGVPWNVHLTIERLNARAAQWIKENFKGAKIRRRKVSPRGTLSVKKNSKRTLLEGPETPFRVTFTNRWAATTLALVCDFFRVKYAQSRLVFRFVDASNGRGHPLTEEQQQIRKEVALELAALQKGA